MTNKEDIYMSYIDIPIIDVSSLFGDDIDAKMDAANQIRLACRGTGFFYASNHGVDVEKLQDITDNFHQTMTDDEKWDLAINAYNKDNFHTRSGYYMAIKGRKAVESYAYINPSFNEEHLMVKSGVPLYEVNAWPDPVKHPYFQPFCEGYYWDMIRLSSLLLRGFALALGKEESFFDTYLSTNDTLSSVRLIRYPYLKDYPPVVTAADGTKLGFGDHLDVSLITILFQTPVPNLQAETSRGWRDVPTSSDNFLVNCGTYMAYITNNYFHAPNHRVKHVNTERYSLPFFVNLAYHTAIHPFTPHKTEKETNVPPIPHGKFLEDGFNALVLKNGQT